MLRSTFKRRVKRDRARGKCTFHFWQQPYLPYAAKPKSNETHEINHTCVCCVAVQPHSTWALDQNGVRMIAAGCWIYLFCTHHDKHNRFTPDKSGRIWPIYLRIRATGLDCLITAVISLISAVWCVWYFTANSIIIFFRSSLLGGREVTTRNKSTQCLLFAGYVIRWIFTSDQAFFFLLVKGKPLIDYWDSEDCWFSSQVVCTAESVFCYPGSRGPFPMEPRVAFFRKRLHSVQCVQGGFARHSWGQGDGRESSQSAEWAGECSEWSAENGECN